MSIIQDALKKVQNNPDDERPCEERAAQSQDTPTLKAEAVPVGGKSESPLKRIIKLRGRPIIEVSFLIGLVLIALWMTAGNHKAGKPEKAKTPDAVSHQEVIYKPILQSPAKSETATVGPAQPQPAEIKPRTLAPDLVLSGIMYLAGRPQAVINNSVVEEGDTVSGARVVSIDRNAVLLNFNDLEITLTLKR